MLIINDEFPEGRETISKWAVYANDTLQLSRFSVTPGIRFDHTSSEGNITSPSLGITYGFENSTILRAFAAHGFNIPTTGARYGVLGGWVANPDLKMETVWSYQAGMETAALKYVWIKFMVFRNDIRNAIDQVVLTNGDSQMQNIGRERREGIVIEAKTAPVFNIAFSAGAELVTAKDLDTGEHVSDVPVQVYDIGIKYDDKDSFNALLQGRHLNWNAIEDEMSQYHSILLDLNVTKKIYQRKEAALEVFVNAHNLLNTAQYLSLYFPNPERWYEGGAAV